MAVDHPDPVLGRHHPWLVTSHAHQRALLRDSRVSADVDQPGYPHLSAAMAARRTQAKTFITMDGADHQRLRRMVTGPFAIRRVERMRPAIQRIVDDAIDDMLAGPTPCDLVTAFALPVPSLVICQLLGVPYDDHAYFQALSSTLVKRDTPVDEALAAQNELLAYLGKLVDAGHDGLLTDLADQLTRDELVNMGRLLLVAGHETTANMIALGTLALLRHPDQLAEVRATPEAIPGAVEELLRYLTIVHTGRRRVALADIPVGDVVIRAGDGIVLASDVANRDPEVFPDPDTLDVHRRGARRHLAFGFGPHQCLGQPLARLELQVAYGTLYRRIPGLRLAVDVSEIAFKHDGLVYGVYSLPVAW
ncbi:cytochrome P450 [Kibdelosporangium lantanae]